MTADKKADTSKQSIAGDEKTGETTSEPASKATLVTSRPIMQNPEVVDDTDNQKEEKTSPVAKGSSKVKIQPLASSPKPEPENDSNKLEEPVKDDDTQPDTSDDAQLEIAQQKNQVTPAEDEAAEESRQAERDANLQKIVDAKTYYLPINAVEKRKTKRFVLLGLLLSITLLLVWLNVALDAGLIQIDGISPLTHFFSS